MRDLDTINASAKSTKHVFTVTLIIPFVMWWGAWALAAGAAPSRSLSDNYLEIFSLGVMSITIFALPIPYIFRWNWQAKYFGAAIFPIIGASAAGMYPILCIARYSTLPVPVRILAPLADAFLIIWWCHRFIKIYKTVYDDKSLFRYIYNEEATAVYYLQQADKKVIEKLLRFDQLPGIKLTVLPMLFAFSLVPFAPLISRVTGLPFIHIFLAISMTPINLMFFGLGTRGWLIFYFYPMKIKKETNKPVYVDKSSHPPISGCPRDRKGVKRAV